MQHVGSSTSLLTARSTVQTSKRYASEQSSEQTVSETNSFATVKPSAAAHWDYEKNVIGPGDVLATSTEKYWFKLPGLGFHGSVQRLLSTFKREGGKKGDKKGGAFITLASVAPEVASQWHLTKNGDVLFAKIASKSNKKYWWQCEADLGHEWEASPSDLIDGGLGCPYCSVGVGNS
jgi:hypothetical protein